MNRALVGQPSWRPVLRASLPAEHMGGRDAVRTGRLEAPLTCLPRFMVPMHARKLPPGGPDDNYSPSRGHFEGRRASS